MALSAKSSFKIQVLVVHYAVNISKHASRIGLTSATDSHRVWAEYGHGSPPARHSVYTTNKHINESICSPRLRRLVTLVHFYDSGAAIVTLVQQLWRWCSICNAGADLWRWCRLVTLVQQLWRWFIFVTLVQQCDAGAAIVTLVQKLWLWCRLMTLVQQLWLWCSKCDAGAAIMTLVQQLWCWCSNCDAGAAIMTLVQQLWLWCRLVTLVQQWTAVEGEDLPNCSSRLVFVADRIYEVYRDRRSRCKIDWVSLSAVMVALMARRSHTYPVNYVHNYWK